MWMCRIIQQSPMRLPLIQSQGRRNNFLRFIKWSSYRFPNLWPLIFPFWKAGMVPLGTGCRGDNVILQSCLFLTYLARPNLFPYFYLRTCLLHYKQWRVQPENCSHFNSFLVYTLFELYFLTCIFPAFYINYWCWSLQLGNCEFLCFLTSLGSLEPTDH